MMEGCTALTLTPLSSPGKRSFEPGIQCILVTADKPAHPLDSRLRALLSGENKGEKGEKVELFPIFS